MKITYFKLRNFSNIKTAMNTNEIEIDFSKCTNKIVLITGPNGGGKTSMLSCLHPFANNGNLDVRNDNPLVVVGEDGYKEIHYRDGSDNYVIKHFYTHSKESHTIKSYIEKNGVELNPNGNQTSFKELIREEMDIEPDYLKLVRLGNNVTNFIDHKATERKSFMGKILSEVDIYLKFYKKVSKDIIELKSIISHLIDKIHKLSIDDPDELQKSQKKLGKRLSELSEKIASLNATMSVVDYELKKYDSPDTIRSMLEKSKNKQVRLDRILSESSNRISSLKDCESLIVKIKSEISIIENFLVSSQSERENLLNRHDKLIGELDSIKKELDKISESVQIKDTEQIIKKIKSQIDERCKQRKVIDSSYPYTKKELEELIIMLDGCNDILYTTYEFGKEPVKKAIEFLVERKNIDSYVESRKNTLSKNKLQAMSEYVFNALVGKHIPIPNCKDSKSCEIMQFYDKIYDLATEIPDTIIEDETFVTYTKLSHQNISTILDNIKEKKNIFIKLPKEIQDMFTLSNLFDRMSNLQPLYDKKPLYAKLSEVTEYELLMSDYKEFQSQKEKLKLLKSLSGNSEYFERRKTEIISEIEETKSEIENIVTIISDYKKDIKSKENELKSLEDLKESIEKKDSLADEISRLQTSYDTVLSLLSQKKETAELLHDISFEFNRLQTEFNNNEYKLAYYKTYTEELSSHNKIYDEMLLVKSALSSKEGIPLLFIQIYLKNVQDITNELLEIIYGDDLYIDSFSITADEFKIPFHTKGTLIKDVCYASQGERSFISLALSFSLIYQSISKYNILLLDEIDATLDTGNRGKFLQVLEKHISMIDGEQVFVISHNNMFNMYPVDVINTENMVDGNNRLSHYIKIGKK